MSRAKERNSVNEFMSSCSSISAHKCRTPIKKNDGYFRVWLNGRSFENDSFFHIADWVRNKLCSICTEKGWNIIVIRQCRPERVWVRMCVCETKKVCAQRKQKSAASTQTSYHTVSYRLIYIVNRNESTLALLAVQWHSSVAPFLSLPLSFYAHHFK